MDGTKTQTRRLRKTNDGCALDADGNIQTVRDQKGQLRYRVGARYTIQTGRGSKGIGQMEITGIRREDVRDISAADAASEGLGYPLGFLTTWLQMYDVDFYFWQQKDLSPVTRHFDGVNWSWVTTSGDHWRHTKQNPAHAATTGTKEALLSALRLRPKERYDAWVLEFKLV